MKKPNKVLILGSGGLKIGQAGEFDYSGSQAIKALKEDGIKTVLVNPNIATIQTSEMFADEVYFVPITEKFVTEVIEKEKPDGILLAFGGQTALNCGVDLKNSGVLKKYRVKVLGTSVETIELSEDRESFANFLRKLNISTPKSKAVTTKKDARKVGKEIGYPLMIRAAYALGGQSSGVARNDKEFEKLLSQAFAFSPQILVEKYLHHFKEIEYEVVRDGEDNCITVCNMENFDPLGIHTGESIVVAPSQTLTNHEYHFLREKAIEIVRNLGIVGECNVQYALNPTSKDGEVDYYVIEVNARLSRSSALASKATGYPLAYVAAKIALGYCLLDIPNQVTGITNSCFEPALDYLVVKIPRWDLEKFAGVDEQIGSSMKSVGEVMAIGRSFEEAIQKAVRMLDIGATGAKECDFKDMEEVWRHITAPTPKRLFAITEALRLGVTVDEIHKKTGIDNWFLYRLDAVVQEQLKLMKDKSLDKKRMLKLKQLGCSDNQIGLLTGQPEEKIRLKRKKMGVIPSVLQIDTLAGEVPAQTNYLYMTYHETKSDVESLGDKGVVVLGSGPYRIGSSVEFDWTCVNTVDKLSKYDKETIVVNCNPETVSTDYDLSSRLYFEELTLERVLDIYDFEQSEGVVVSVGGQTPNNLVPKLSKNNIPILGTSAKSIDRAENRSKFSKMLDDLNIPQPAWQKVTSWKEVSAFAKKVEFPVLIRPSYVLSGAAMRVCYYEEELKKFLQEAVVVSNEYPLTVSKFMAYAKELEYDGVAQKGEMIVEALSEHIEFTGVHSGDATIAYPAQKVFLKTAHEIRRMSAKIIKELNISGPFNIQYLALDNRVYVIEINLRASRTFPFISKVSGVNMAHMIVDSFYGKAKPVEIPYPSHVGVKVPQFSFARLAGADPVLKVEMASTGEVACFGDNLEEAYLKSVLSTGIDVLEKTALITVGGVVNKKQFLSSAVRLSKLGFSLYATQNTHDFLKEHGVKSTRVYKSFKNRHPNSVDIIQKRKVSLVINISKRFEETFKDHTNLVSDGFQIRREAIDQNVPLFTDLNTAKLFIKALTVYEKKPLPVKPWSYYKNGK